MDLDRREVLRVGSLALCGWRAFGAAPEVRAAKSCIFLSLVGGPSQIDTWDPKPDAPAHVRSPFRPIRTNVKGVQISELFPRMAQVAQHYALVRSCSYTAIPTHEIGNRIVQTGRLDAEEVEHPHLGAVVSRVLGPVEGVPPNVLLPGPVERLQCGESDAQTAGYLGPEHEAFVPQYRRRVDALDLSDEPEGVRLRYGRTRFGQNCLQARRFVEAGARFVTVNMFQRVSGEPTWDAHGSRPYSSLTAYRDVVAPTFDMAFSALLEDLASSGRLAETLVVATGEFGRSPRFNLAGGRDHWPQCWTAILAGGGVRGGQVLGESDSIGAEPRERPVSPAEMAATIYHVMGISPRTTLRMRNNETMPIVDSGAKPLYELL